MESNRLTLLVPFMRRATGSTDAAPAQSLTMTLATTEASPFVYSLLGADLIATPELLFQPGSEQWRVSVNGPLTISVQWADSAAVTWALPAMAQSFDVAARGDDAILLRGALVLEKPDTLTDAVTNLFAALWPTGQVDDVYALRVEPLGLHTVGMLPWSPRLTGTVAASGAAEEAGSALLRVMDQLENPTWLLTNYIVDPTWISAGALVQWYAGRVEHGRIQGKTFVDNVRCQPPETCTVSLVRDNDNGQVRWDAHDLGVEIVIGGGEVDEAYFLPTTLAGTMAKDAAGVWQDDGRVRFYAGPQENTNASQASLTIVHNADPARAVQLELAGQRLIRAIVPSRSIARPAGEDVVDPGYQRAWLCHETGWVGFDFLPTAQQRRGELQRSATLLGVIEFDQLLAQLRNDEVAANRLTVQLGALVQTAVEIAFTFAAQSAKLEQLTLTLFDADVVVETLPLWYAPPAAVTYDNGVAAIADSDAPPDEAAAASVEQLPNLLSAPAAPAENENENEGAGEVGGIAALQVARFLSDLPKADADETSVDWTEGAPAQLAATLTSVGDEMALTLRAPNVQLWHALPGLPLVQSHARAAKASASRDLDENRGLLPLLLSPQSDQPPELTLAFPTNALPKVAKPALPTTVDRSAEWALPGDVRNRRFFLPTLPGIEVTLTSDHARWVYRHAIPALDEAYAETVETPDEQPTTDGISADPAGGINALGVDFTRVEGTEAFEIAPTPSSSAQGWLHATPGGDLSLESVDFEPAGRFPTLGLELGGNQLSFSRTDNINGLSWGLHVNPGAQGAGLPTSIVSLGAEDGDKIRLNNSGQPLLVQRRADSDDAIVTQDGVGWVTVEATAARTPHLRLVNGSWQEGANITRKVQLSSVGGDRLYLELAGVAEGKYAELDPTTWTEQAWTLHDGTGGWPRFSGFPLFPLSLCAVIYEGGSLTIAVDGILMANVPDQPRAHSSAAQPTLLPEDALGVVQLEFIGAWADDSLKLSAVQGEINWHFPVNAPIDQDEETAYLVHLHAEITGWQDAGQGLFNDARAIDLELLAAALHHPLGLIQFVADEEEEAVATPVGNGRLVHLRQSGEPISWLQVAIARGAHEWQLDDIIVLPDQKHPPAIDHYAFAWRHNDWRLRLDYSANGHVVNAATLADLQGCNGETRRLPVETILGVDWCNVINPQQLGLLSGLFQDPPEEYQMLFDQAPNNDEPTSLWPINGEAKVAPTIALLGLVPGCQATFVATRVAHFLATPAQTPKQLLLGLHPTGEPTADSLSQVADPYLRAWLAHLLIKQPEQPLPRGWRLRWLAATLPGEQPRVAQWWLMPQQGAKELLPALPLTLQRTGPRHFAFVVADVAMAPPAASPHALFYAQQVVSGVAAVTFAPGFVDLELLIADLHLKLRDRHRRTMGTVTMIDADTVVDSDTPTIPPLSTDYASDAIETVGVMVNWETAAGKRHGAGVWRSTPRLADPHSAVAPTSALRELTWLNAATGQAWPAVNIDATAALLGKPHAIAAVRPYEWSSLLGWQHVSIVGMQPEAAHIFAAHNGHQLFQLTMTEAPNPEPTPLVLATPDDIEAYYGAMHVIMDPLPAWDQCSFHHLAGGPGCVVWSAHRYEEECLRYQIVDVDVADDAAQLADAATTATSAALDGIYCILLEPHFAYEDRFIPLRVDADFGPVGVSTGLHALAVCDNRTVIVAQNRSDGTGVLSAFAYVDFTCNDRFMPYFRLVAQRATAPVASLAAVKNGVFVGFADGEIAHWVPEQDTLQHFATHAPSIRDLATLAGDEGADRLFVLDTAGELWSYSRDHGVENGEKLDTGISALAIARAPVLPGTAGAVDLSGSSKLLALALADPVPRSRCDGVLRLTNDGHATLECTGTLVLHDDLGYQQRPHPLQGHAHLLEFALHGAHVPPTAILAGDGPDQDLLLAGIAAHTLRLPDRQIRWQAPQRLRLTTFARLTAQGALALPTHSHDISTWLAIDAGALFWLRSVTAQLATAKSQVVVQSATVDAASMEVLLAVRPQHASWVTAGKAQAVRMPALIARGFALHQQSRTLQIPQADSLTLPSPYTTAGMQPSRPTPPAVEALPTIQFHERRPESSWLTTAVLAQLLQPTPEQDNRTSGDFAPAFANGAGPRLLPSDATLDDLGDLLSIIPKETVTLDAAALAWQRWPEGAAPQLYAAMLIEFPYWVDFAAAPAVATRDPDLQLVVMSNRRLIRLAQTRLEAQREAAPGNGAEDSSGDGAEKRTDAALVTRIVAWARAQLAAHNRQEAALILVNYKHWLWLPRPATQGYAEDPYALPGQLAASAAHALLDPRCRLPGQPDMPIVKADSARGLLLFNAEPTAQPAIALPAATRFRIAPLSELPDPTAPDSTGRGTLRRAQVVAQVVAQDNEDNESDRAIYPHTPLLTQRDDVPFVVQRQESYPRLNAHAQQRQAALTLTPDPEHSALVLPPLIDIVSWATRPGELMRSTWSLQAASADGSEVGQALPVWATLRRPRSQAGRAEAIRLRQTHGIAAGRGLFRHVTFSVTQVRGVTALPTKDATAGPTENAFVLALTTRGDLFGGEQVTGPSALPQALSKPAQLYYREAEPAPQLEPAAFHLLAEGELAPPIDEPTQWQRTMLIWSKSADEVPDLPLTWQEPPDADQSHWKIGAIDESMGIVYADLTAAAWTVFSAVNEPLVQLLTIVLDASAEHATDLIKTLQSVAAEESSTSPLRLLIVRYTATKSLDDDVLTVEPKLYAALAVSLLNEAGRFTAPKLSVSLLTWPLGETGTVDPIDTDEDTNAVNSLMVAGYGRLGNEDFGVVEPHLSKMEAGDRRQVEWLRTTQLRALHRAGGRDKTYHYDIVAYGPGGELIRTDDA